MRPATTNTAPVTNIQMDRSVGEPVNVRDTSEVKECEALKPKTSKMMPPTNRARAIAVFMTFSFFKFSGADKPPHQLTSLLDSHNSG